jgi:hypothetical protein
VIKTTTTTTKTKRFKMKEKKTKSTKSTQTENLTTKNQLIYQNVLQTEHTTIISGNRSIKNNNVHYDLIIAWRSV